MLVQTDYQGAQAALYRIHKQLLYDMAAESFAVGFSIGAITFLSLPTSTKQMITQVDQLMYEVKKSSKNAIKHQLIE